MNSLIAHANALFESFENVLAQFIINFHFHVHCKCSQNEEPDNKTESAVVSFKRPLYAMTHLLNSALNCIDVKNVYENQCALEMMFCIARFEFAQMLIQIVVERYSRHNMIILMARKLLHQLRFLHYHCELCNFSQFRIALFQMKLFCKNICCSANHNFVPVHSDLMDVLEFQVGMKHSVALSQATFSATLFFELKELFSVHDSSMYSDFFDRGFQSLSLVCCNSTSRHYRLGLFRVFSEVVIHKEVGCDRDHTKVEETFSKAEFSPAMPNLCPNVKSPIDTEQDLMNYLFSTFNKCEMAYALDFSLNNLRR